MAEDKQGLKNLPTVETLENEIRKEVMLLLEALDVLVVKKNQLAIEEDRLKDRLEQLQKQTDRPGFRHGWLTFKAQMVEGRKTLDRMLLMENGCPAAVLNASYKTGAPYVMTTFKHLEEE